MAARGTLGAVRALTPFAVLAAVAVGCGAPAPRGPGIDVDRALATVNHLAGVIGPRTQGSREAVDTAAWIEAQLTASRIAVERLAVGTVELPSITVMGAQYRHAHSVTVTDPDLVMRFGTGSGKALLVMAHYDTVAGSPGAVDNAAGVAVVLELARVLAAEPPSQPVMLVFTAAEEIGLVGAEALAAEYADRTSFAIALDLIGGDGELVVNGASELIGSSELRWLAAAAERTGVSLDVPAVHRVVSRWWPSAERSDHGPFTRRGTRAIHFYNRGQGDDWIDLAYHSDRDVSSRVHRGALADAGRLLRALVATPPPAHTGDGFWLPFVRGVVVSRGVLIAVELVLALGVVVMLVMSRVGLLAWLARSREAAKGPALIMGALCYAVAVVIAYVIERLTRGEHLGLWLHAPLRALIGHALVITGVFGLATRAVARFAPWRGESRFLAVAALMPLVIGLAWLALGGAELAWVWLVPAAVIAIAPLIPTPTASAARVASQIFVGLAVAMSALPIVLTLHPLRLREAAWNGFLPVTVPFAPVVGLCGVPVVAAVAWALRRRVPAGPMGTLVLGVGCGLLVIGGLVVAVTTPAPCSPSEFMRFMLACERV